MGSRSRTAATGDVTTHASISESLSAVRLRTAVEADIPALMRIELASFSDPWNASAFRSLLQASAARITVAQLDEAVVGYSAVLRAADEAELANLAVEATWQGRGIGRTLLAAAQATAAAEGVAAMYLEVRESNRSARHLYEALNFATIGRRRGYYRQPDEDALVMQWRPGPRDAPHAA